MSFLVQIYKIICNTVEATKTLILRQNNTKLKYFFTSRETIPLKIVKASESVFFLHTRKLTSVGGGGGGLAV
jgi:hypothetical protein